MTPAEPEIKDKDCYVAWRVQQEFEYARYKGLWIKSTKHYQIVAGLKAELAELEATHTFWFETAKDSIPKAKVQELSKELNEASFLSHEQRYKASTMVDKLLSGKEKGQ